MRFYTQRHRHCRGIDRPLRSFYTLTTGGPHKGVRRSNAVYAPYGRSSG